MPEQFLAYRERAGAKIITSDGDKTLQEARSETLAPVEASGAEQVQIQQRIDQALASARAVQGEKIAQSTYNTAWIKANDTHRFQNVVAFSRAAKENQHEKMAEGFVAFQRAAQALNPPDTPATEQLMMLAENQVSASSTSADTGSTYRGWIGVRMNDSPNHLIRHRPKASKNPGHSPYAWVRSTTPTSIQDQMLIQSRCLIYPLR